MALLFLTYLVCCLLVAYLARDRVIGFIGFFVLSLIFTPLIMFFVFLLERSVATAPSWNSE
jgi:hypothetical protein